MGWLGGLIGGGGQQLANYGQQMRGLLEQRRESMANLISRQAQEENDPTRRAELYSHASDLLGNKDMSGILPKLVKTIQNHFQSDHALGQMTQPQQGQDQQISVGAPAGLGQVPGTTTKPSAPAAQPPTSPVSPEAQGPQAVSQPASIGMGGMIAPVEAQAPAPPPPQPTGPIQPVGAGQTAGTSDENFGFPVIPDAMAVKNKYMTDPMWNAPVNRPAMSAAMNAEIEHNEGLRQKIDTEKFEYNRTLHALGSMNKPEVQAARESLKASGVPESMINPMLISALTKSPMMPAGMMSLVRVHQSAVDATTMTPQEKMQYGIPPDATGKYTVDLNGMGGPMGTSRQGWAGLEKTTSAQGVQGVESSNQALGNGGVLTAPGGGASHIGSVIAPHTVTMANGTTGFQSPLAAQAGNQPVPTGGIAPPMMPHTTSSLRSISTMDNDGNPVTQLVPVTSTVTRGGAGAVGGAPGGSAGTPAVGGVRSFPKAFTPQQQLHGEQQLGQYNMAIDRMTDIQKQLPLLNSMIESGKLSMEMDSSGVVRAAVNRMLPMTPAEAKFVGNFRTMMEDINLLRGPMGATGFRGPEAWAALQAQRGQLLANPEITKQVLGNSLTALKAQQQPLAKRFHAASPAKIEPVGGSDEDEQIKALLKKHGH